MSADVEYYIRHNYVWQKLPANIKQALSNSQREYDKTALTFSVKNQLRYKGNLVRSIRRDERRYYEDLLHYSREHLMLYPYHLSDVMVKGLRVTPFSYYTDIMAEIMTQEKSYDSLPNFTAADCLRLLGIGRNQYIDLMNQCRSSKKFFRKRPIRELLPIQPVESVSIDAWWIVQTGCITEEDIKQLCSPTEKDMVDMIIDSGAQTAGDLCYRVLHSLYRKGLVYMDVCIQDDDCIIVPPLEGFVMNRVLGDYFETLLYKIFVSIDEHTSVAELASVLQIDLQLVKNAVSMYCRLGFAKKKGQEILVEDLHPSWGEMQSLPKKVTADQLLIDWSTTLMESSTPDLLMTSTPDSVTTEGPSELNQLSTPVAGSKRIAFLFDSTLTAFLMMGNLSPGLKSHAVTMFEVGKLSDESMDSFVAELEKVGSDAEGEAQRYFDHAITLRHTIKFLRYNKQLCPDVELSATGAGIDLIRCESLLSLDQATRARVLNKNYMLLVSMAPLSNEIRPVSSCTPQHIGPAIPEVNSVWFKLYSYHLTGYGPPSVLLVKGTKLRRLPSVLQDYERLLVTTWGHDPGVITTSNILLTLNDALTHSAVLVQAHGCHTDGQIAFVPFPFDKNTSSAPFSRHNLSAHPAIQKLQAEVDLEHTCGYVTLLNMRSSTPDHDQNCQTFVRDSSLEIDKLMVTMLGTVRAGSESSSSAASMENLDRPQNGFTNQNSVHMLTSELDSLDVCSNNSNTSLDQGDIRNKMKLDLKVEFQEPSSERDLCETDWTLLDCCFGIPLFESSINKEVCRRITMNRLCDKDSLECLLQSGRKLTLHLLDFIAQFQDVPVIAEHSPEKLSLNVPVMSEQSIPHPTYSLVFSNGKLYKWPGQ